MVKSFICRSLLSVLFCAAGFATFSQVTPPDPYASSLKINFVRTWDAAAPETNPATLVARPLKDVRQTTQYFDGLGRPLQTVVKKGSLVTNPLNPASSASAADLVTAVVYDAFGRETYKYLPFAANNTGSNSSVNDGAFKNNPFQQQEAFMGAQFGSQGENWFYGQTVFEASPLNRVLETYAPGNSWVGTNGEVNENNRRGVKMKYWINTVGDSVRIWNVTDVTNSFGSYNTTQTYAAGELYKNATVDEGGHQVIEYTDKEDKVMLKKVQLTAEADNGSGSGHAGWLCTYYIYDDLNNLRCVVQPRGVELLLQNSWNMGALSGAILNEQCFRYEYDHRNRMIMKKVPGAGEVWMVYDQWDRLVLTQDANLRGQHIWLFTKYDQLNRPIQTGLWPNATYTTRSTMQDYLNTQNLGRYETYQTASWPFYSLNQSFPVITMSNVYTMTYYDDYSWASFYGNYATKDNSYDSYFATPDNNNWPYPQPLTESAQTRGLVTGQWSRMGGGLLTATFYDDKGRVIQTKHLNQTTGIDITTTQYNFAGQPLQTVLRHQKSGANAQTSLVITKVTYDELGRLIKTEKKVSNSLINSGALPAEWTVIAQNEYDALGQLKKKKIGQRKDASVEYTDDPLDSLEYDYNIRGWLLGMNRNFATDTTSTANYFGFDLGYDKDAFLVNGTSQSYAGKQYNGNIGGMLWRSTGDDKLRKYDFTYDAVNRLTNAAFTQLNNNAFSTAAGIDFSATGLTYDANGNILTMNQKGWKPGSSATIDSLLYTYYDYSNRLKNVLDHQNDTATRLGDFRSSKAYMDALSQTKTTGATDYTYDANGNLATDLNKDISHGGGTAIVYNHLNLPTTIHINGKGSIEYLYDDFGTKLKKVVHETGKPDKTTMYISGFVYENDTLQFLSHEEGRIRLNPETNAFVYDYFIKDHLGNVRMVLTEEQQRDQYPAATFEDASVSNEELYYENVDMQRATRPDDFYTSGSNGAKVQLLRKSTQSIGAGKLLKVMATDTVHVKVDYYMPNETTNNTHANGLNTVIASLLSLLDGGGAPAALKGSGSTITNGLQNSGIFTGFLEPQGAGSSSSMPKAYLNILFFDEQFNFVQESSEIVQVSTKGSGQTIYRVNGTAKVAAKNGYAYIYVSNESENFVYFDNLQITHGRGAVLEETHYYPFGLTMAGISSKALKSSYAENKLRYNGIEKEDGLGIEIYDAKLRELDPQIGRWWQVDPKTESMEMWSPYASNYDNPIKYSDPLGDEGQGCCWGDLLLKTGAKLAENHMRAQNALVEKVDETVEQAGENFQMRWAARADPIHQAIDNPFSMIGGLFGIELNTTQKVLVLEANATKAAAANEVRTIVTVEVKATPYSNLKDSKSVGPGKGFTSAQKKKIIEANKQQNGGVIKSDKSGEVLNPAKQSKRGQRADMNQAEIDHVTPKSKGGMNSFSNAQVLSKKENLKKSNKEMQ